MERGEWDWDRDGRDWRQLPSLCWPPGILCACVPLPRLCDVPAHPPYQVSLSCLPFFSLSLLTTTFSLLSKPAFCSLLLLKPFSFYSISIHGHSQPSAGWRQEKNWLVKRKKKGKESEGRTGQLGQERWAGGTTVPLFSVTVFFWQATHHHMPCYCAHVPDLCPAPACPAIIYISLSLSLSLISQNTSPYLASGVLAGTNTRGALLLPSPCPSCNTVALCLCVTCVFCLCVFSCATLPAFGEGRTRWDRHAALPLTLVFVCSPL